MSNFILGIYATAYVLGGEIKSGMKRMQSEDTGASAVEIAVITAGILAATIAVVAVIAAVINKYAGQIN